MYIDRDAIFTSALIYFILAILFSRMPPLPEEALQLCCCSVPLSQHIWWNRQIFLR